MEDNKNSHTFQFFAHVRLEDPSHFLNEDEYEVLQRLMPSIQRLEREFSRRPQHAWDFEGRFNEFVREETCAWRQRGTERPAQLLLRPSGSITAPIAHHLLNPTFYVADPYSSETDDPSNPTINLLHENGFSAQNSFMLDQICCREETLIYLHLWTEDVQKPHDDFVRDLRRNMSAIVEICWGEVVWRKVEQKSRLVRFPLWGKYKDVKLYLDMEEDGKTLKRFVFWVHHPQWFFRPRPATTTNGIPDRTIQAEIQDAALGLAARLVGLSIKDNFYAQYRHKKYPRLTKEQRDVREDQMVSAREELRVAFPMKAQEEEERQSRLEIKRREQGRQIRQILLDLEEDQKKELEGNHIEKAMKNTDLELWRFHSEKVQRLLKSWLAVSQVISHQNPSLDCLAKERSSDTGSSAVVDSDWFDLPTEIIDWLQSQNGLKVDGVAIESREELETAFLLLGCGENALQTGHIRTSSIEELALQVAWTHIEAIVRKRRHIILELTIPGTPEQVMQRKCSSCGLRVLDDAFPLFATRKRVAYVVRTLEVGGCCRPECKGRTDLVPIDEWQPHIRGTRKVLENPPNKKGRGDFDSFLCRSEDELDGLPKTVHTICMTCGSPKLCGYPRWTIEKEPRFVIPRLKCKGCKGKDRNFRPVDNWETINSTVLSKFWTKVTSEVFDPRDYPAVRQRFLRKASFFTMKVVLRRLRQQHLRDVQGTGSSRKRKGLITQSTVDQE